MLKCTNNVYYNLENKKAQYCKTHSTKEMVDKIKYKELRCPIQKSIYCKEHKEND